MAHRTKTVGSGKDYATLALALAGEASYDYNVTNDTAETVDGFTNIALEFQVYASTESNTILFPNFLTDATHRILVRVMPGERHAGYWSASKYNLAVSGATALGVYESHVVFDGLQLRGGATPGQALYLDAGTGMVFTNCLIDGVTTSPVKALNSAAAIFNNCILTSTAGLAELYSASSSLTFLNCDLVGGFYQANGASIFKNCYASRPTDDGYCYYKAAGTMAWTTCASSDSTVRSGVTASVPFSTATFLSVTAGADYLKVAPGGPLENAGTDYSGGDGGNWLLGAVDVSGASRAGTWDIGPWEAIAGSAGSTLQYALPNADVTDGGWLNELGVNANLHLSVDDLTTDDSTYIQSKASPIFDQCVVGLSAIKVPVAGEVLMRVRVKLV